MARWRIDPVSFSIAALSLVGVGYVIHARADGIPSTNTLTYAGTLANSSGPLSGSHTITVSLYSAASGGTQQCTSGPTAVTVTSAGYFSVPLPSGCTAYVAGNPNEWVDVMVDGTDTGTVQIGAVPYAVTANNAVTADNPSDGGALATTLSTIQSNVTTAQGNITTLQSNVSTLQSETFSATTLELNLTDPSTDNWEGFATACLSNVDTNIGSCTVAASRKCVGSGYNGGFFVGEGSASLRSIVCFSY